MRYHERPYRPAADPRDPNVVHFPVAASGEPDLRLPAELADGAHLEPLPPGAYGLPGPAYLYIRVREPQPPAAGRACCGGDDDDDEENDGDNGGGGHAHGRWAIGVLVLIGMFIAGLIAFSAVSARRAEPFDGPIEPSASWAEAESVLGGWAGAISVYVATNGAFPAEYYDGITLDEAGPLVGYGEEQWPWLETFEPWQFTFTRADDLGENGYQLICVGAAVNPMSPPGEMHYRSDGTWERWNVVRFEGPRSPNQRRRSFP